MENVDEATTVQPKDIKRVAKDTSKQKYVSDRKEN